jgi:hypothetical protein
MEVYKLIKEGESYKLFKNGNSPINIVAKFPWEITHPGLSKENCDLIFNNSNHSSINVLLKKLKKIKGKSCLILKENYESI